MARKFTTPIDLTSLELLNAKAHNLGSDPTGLGSGDKGLIWFNTATSKWMYWNGTTAIDPLARANHSGTQTASTVSDLATVVKAYRLDEFAAPNTSVSMGTQKLTSLLAGTTGTDAVNKTQLDAVAASAATGTSIKDPVRAASLANTVIASTGNGASMDGVTLATTDRVLLKAQTAPAENGIYVVGASALTRSADMDATTEVKPGTMLYVTEGTVNGDKAFAVTSDAAITVGTTAMTWGQIGSSATYTAGDGIDITGTVVSAKPVSGGYITNGGSGFDADITKLARFKAGAIPATTGGMFSVSGAVVTINHALSNYGARLTLRAYTSPSAGYSAGQLVEAEEVASDADNLVVTLPLAPVSNAWYASVVG